MEKKKEKIMTEEKYEIQVALDDAHVQTVALALAMGRAAVAHVYNTPTVLEDIDAAIDAWNIVINRAPQALKRAKFSCMERAGEVRKESGK